jgi:hypothetical protein
MKIAAAALAIAAASLGACTQEAGPKPLSAPASPVDATNAPPKLSAAQEQFFKTLSARCGQAFAGSLASDAAADSDMAGKPLVMHIRRCTPDRIEIPFHVGGQATADGWDRSRTWIISRTATGLRLKHDHRHADGSADPVTMYGGDTANAGTASRQEFPVDAESIANFQANGLAASITNVWHVEVTKEGYTYGLARANRDFRVHFDFAKPIVPPPPAPWGW